jgi:hypothetical protein
MRRMARWDLEVSWGRERNLLSRAGVTPDGCLVTYKMLCNDTKKIWILSTDETLIIFYVNLERSGQDCF